MSKTIEQQRAALAWQQVESLVGQNGFDKYSQRLQGFPVELHTAGLGQTVAFYRAKGREDQQNEHHRVLQHLAAWLLRNRPEGERTPNDLMQAITQGDARRYRQLTDEAHAYVAWLKRFAAARNA